MLSFFEILSLRSRMRVWGVALSSIAGGGESFPNRLEREPQLSCQILRRFTPLNDGIEGARFNNSSEGETPPLQVRGRATLGLIDSIAALQNDKVGETMKNRRGITAIF